MRKSVHIYILCLLLVCLTACGKDSTVDQATCPHEHWENGVCQDCGYVCNYHTWENNVCTRCGLECKHENRVNGICPDCGDICEHESFSNGVCTECGYVCPHEEHDLFGRCLLCKAYVGHSYHDFVCSCGKQVPLATSSFSVSNFEACELGGTVETVYYNPIDYSSTEAGATLSKKMNIYLPYNYDPSQPYNVLVLMHGMYSDEDYWLFDSNQWTFDGEEYCTKNLLDNMYREGLCKNVIVVTPTFYRDSSNKDSYVREREQYQLMLELRNDILPYIVSHYSTYAETPDTAGISAARDHFAYAGLSMGSIYAYNTILPDGIDLFSWFGCFSGSECYPKSVRAALNSDENINYEINMFYNACGDADSMLLQHYSDYLDVVSYVKRLSEGQNAVFVHHPHLGHEFQCWAMDLYNCMLLFFN